MSRMEDKALEVAAAESGRARLELQGSHRAALGWLAGVGQLAVTTVVSLVLTRVVVHHVGREVYGAWRAISQWAGYMGVGSALAIYPALPFFVKARREAGAVGMAAVLKRVLGAYYKVGAAGLLLGLLLAPLLPRLLHLRGSGHEPAVVAAFLIFVVVCYAVGGLETYSTVLHVTERSYFVRLILVIQNLVSVSAVCAAAVLGWGLAGMAGGACLGVVTGCVLFWRVARRLLPPMRQVESAAISAKEVREQTVAISASVYADRVNLLSDNIVVALLFGSGTVASFALTQQPILLAGTLVKDLGRVCWAGLARLSGDAASHRERLIEGLRLATGMGCVLLAVAVVCDRPFLRLWVGSQYFAGGGLVLATAGAAALLALSGFFAALLDANGHAQRRMKFAVGGAVLNVGSSLVFARMWGPIGVPLGTMAGMLLTESWFNLRLYCHLTTLRAREVGAAVLWTVLQAVPYWLGVAYLAGRLPSRLTWIELGGLGIMLLASGGLYLWLVLLRGSERRMWMLRMRALLVRE